MRTILAPRANRMKKKEKISSEQRRQRSTQVLGPAAYRNQGSTCPQNTRCGKSKHSLRIDAVTMDGA